MAHQWVIAHRLRNTDLKHFLKFAVIIINNSQSKMFAEQRLLFLYVVAVHVRKTMKRRTANRG